MSYIVYTPNNKKLKTQFQDRFNSIFYDRFHQRKNLIRSSDWFDHIGL